MKCTDSEIIKILRIAHQHKVFKEYDIDPGDKVFNIADSIEKNGMDEVYIMLNVDDGLAIDPDDISKSYSNYKNCLCNELIQCPDGYLEQIIPIPSMEIIMTVLSDFDYDEITQRDGIFLNIKDGITDDIIITIRSDTMYNTYLLGAVYCVIGNDKKFRNMYPEYVYKI